jgi:hypothetical protein
MRPNARTVVVASLFAVACGVVTAAAEEPTAPPTTRPSSIGRYSTQTVVLPGAMGAVVAITDHQRQTLYYYRMERDALVLQDTIDLAAAGQPRIARNEAKHETPEPAGITPPGESPKPTTVKVAPAVSKKPEVYLSVSDGNKLSSNGVTLNADELPLFVTEVAAGQRVVIRGFNRTDVAQLVATRDRLRAAGADDVRLDLAPESADDRSTVLLELRSDGSLRTSSMMKSSIPVPDDQLALFSKEVVAGRSVRVMPGGSDVTLTQLAATRDRLKAAGIADVTFSGQAE